MAGNSVTLTFAGDSKSLERSFDRVGKGAGAMADDLTDAARETSRFSGGIEKMNSKIDDSESKFMGAADLVDGLSGALGISLGPTVDYARAFGDIAGGFTATLGPALEGITGKIGKLSFVTKVQTGAQMALNAVMNANPIFLVVTAIAALTAGFIIAYKKSETFRNIVNGAMDSVKRAIGWVGDQMSWLIDEIVSVGKGAAREIGKIAEIITTPYRLAFNGIAWLWNNTVGRLSFSIPGWVPKIGGQGFDVPDIPQLASGGVVKASPGGTLALLGEGGHDEMVLPLTGPNSRGGGAGANVTIGFDRQAGSAMISFLRIEVQKRGGNVQTVLGTASGGRTN